MKQYSVTTTKKDPEVTLKIPAEILRDLALRSEENGRSIEVELAIRLAHSLERDAQMIDTDNEIAYKAFEIARALLNK